MKKAILLISFLLYASTASFAQNSEKTDSHGKIVLTLSQLGKSHTYAVQNMNYNLSRVAYDTVDNHPVTTMIQVMVADPDDFFLQAISEAKSKTSDIKIQYYNKENRLIRTLESHTCFMFSVSEVFDVAYEDMQAQGMYVDFRSDNLSINGVKIRASN